MLSIKPLPFLFYLKLEVVKATCSEFNVRWGRMNVPNKAQRFSRKEGNKWKAVEIILDLMKRIVNDAHLWLIIPFLQRFDLSFNYKATQVFWSVCVPNDCLLPLWLASIVDVFIVHEVFHHTLSYSLISHCVILHYITQSTCCVSWHYQHAVLHHTLYMLLHYTIYMLCNITLSICEKCIVLSHVVLNHSHHSTYIDLHVSVHYKVTGSDFTILFSYRNTLIYIKDFCFLLPAWSGAHTPKTDRLFCRVVTTGGLSEMPMGGLLINSVLSPAQTHQMSDAETHSLHL